MLPNETEFKQVGVLPGEKINMSFDENSLGFLADVLINLYSDKEMAVIREYSTNARDSHRRAGTNRPIEITTPSYLSYFFKVKDYGVGMSKDDIINVYSKYGASTKRFTNNETGMLGLGCKSALTYTDQFTIISIKDGVKINVAVSRAVDGGGSMTVLSETETTEPNGVEIVIPVTRNNSFIHKCEQFFQYWDEHEVLINGKPPVRAKLNKISDRVFFKENTDYYDSPTLVMGGVPYKIDQEQVKFSGGFVAFVEIGSVSFQPSREYLHYTPKTIATLKDLKQEYKDNLIKTIQSDIDIQPTRLEAVKCLMNWTSKLRWEDVRFVTGDWKYKGEDFQLKFSFPYCWKYGRGFTNISYSQINLTDLEKSVIVYGFEAEKLTAYQKQKLSLWGENNGMSSPTFYFCKDVPGDGWLEDIKQVDWKDILAVKISRGPRGPKQPLQKPSYDMYSGGKYSSAKDFDDTKPILYSTKTEWKSVTTEGYRIDLAFPDAQFVFIGENRKKKFLAANPKAQPLKDGLRDLLDKYIDNLTPEEKSYLKSDQYELAKYSKLDASQVDDPELAKVIETNAIEDIIVKAQKTWQCLCSLGWEIGRHDLHNMFETESITNWVPERYPLLEVLLQRSPWSAGQSYWDHVYLYVNRVYERYNNKGV